MKTKRSREDVAPEEPSNLTLEEESTRRKLLLSRGLRKQLSSTVQTLARTKDSLELERNAARAQLEQLQGEMQAAQALRESLEARVAELEQATQQVQSSVDVVERLRQENQQAMRAYLDQLQAINVSLREETQGFADILDSESQRLAYVEYFQDVLAMLQRNGDFANIIFNEDNVPASAREVRSLYERLEALLDVVPVTRDDFNDSLLALEIFSEAPAAE